MTLSRREAEPTQPSVCIYFSIIQFDVGGLCFAEAFLTQTPFLCAKSFLLAEFVLWLACEIRTRSQAFIFPWLRSCYG